MSDWWQLSDREGYLVTRLRIQQEPTDLNDFSGILGHVDAMFVAGSSDMYDNIAVNTGFLGLVTGHVVGPMSKRGERTSPRLGRGFRVSPRPDEVEAQKVVRAQWIQCGGAR